MNLRDFTILEQFENRLQYRESVNALRHHLIGTPEPIHAMTRVERMNYESITLAHRIACGRNGPSRYRTTDVSIVNGRTGTLGVAYAPPAWYLIPPLMRELQVQLFPITPIPAHLVLFHASQLHAMFLCIHPFADGNGRTARLLERWYLSRHFGAWAWNIDTDTYYRQHRDAYVDNLRALGSTWNNLQWERIVPFALMLPAAIEAQLETLTAKTLRE